MKNKSIHKYLQKVREKSGIDQLAPREKTVLIIGVLFVTGFVVLQTVIFPYIDARTKLIKSIDRKHNDLVSIQLLQAEYAELQAKEGGIKKSLTRRVPTFSLFTFLEQQAQKARVKEQIKYMKPSVIEKDGMLNESVVEMKLQDITLEKIVHFLRLVESDENVVSIKRISIQSNAKNQGYLDVILQIVTFVEAG